MRKKQGNAKKFLLIIIVFFLIGFFGYRFLESQSYKIDSEEILEVYNQDKHSQYFYSKLNEKDQETYRRIYYTFVNFSKSIPLEENDSDKVSDIFQNVIDDHPEIFYINPEFQYTDTHKFIFIPKFNFSKEQVENTNRAIQQKTNEIIQKANQQKDDIQKAKILYDYIIKSVEYKEQTDVDQRIPSALLDQKSVCAGYARAYQYLLHQINIPCAYITGDSKVETESKPGYDGHAWNMVKINGDYYYCDTTWGDTVDDDMEHACYAYFLMDSDDMLKCYQPDGAYEKTLELGNPYFHSIDGYMNKYDENVLSRAIQRGLKDKTRIAEIKCENQAVYERVKRNLKSDYLGYRLLTKNGCWSDHSFYYCMDEFQVIELYY